MPDLFGARTVKVINWWFWTVKGIAPAGKNTVVVNPFVTPPKGIGGENSKLKGLWPPFALINRPSPAVPGFPSTKDRNELQLPVVAPIARATSNMPDPKLPGPGRAVFFNRCTTCDADKFGSLAQTSAAAPATRGAAKE